MALAERDKEGLAFGEKHRPSVAGDARGTLDHGPVFGAVQVMAGWKRLARFDPVAADLEPVTGVEELADGSFR